MTEHQEVDQFGTTGRKLIPHSGQGRAILGIVILLSAALTIGGFVWMLNAGSKLTGLGVALGTMLFLVVTMYGASLLRASVSAGNSHAH